MTIMMILRSEESCRVYTDTRQHKHKESEEVHEYKHINNEAGELEMMLISPSMLQHS